MKPVICVTEREYAKAESIFSKSGDIKCIPAPSSESELAMSISRNRAFGAIVGVEAYENLLYSALPRGGIISRFGVGHDGIDKSKATQSGIIVTNTPGVLNDSVAEHTIWLIGALARNIAEYNQNIRNAKWFSSSGFEVREKTLLILGCGQIGCRVAKIASFGMGLNVIGYDTSDFNTQEMKIKWGIKKISSSIDDIIGSADFVSVHLPLNRYTYHYVNKSLLSKMSNHSYLINTARGDIVDEIALFDAVISGQIAGAALDVFHNEPYMPVNPEKDLRKLSEVILTPHVGSNTLEACRKMANRTLAAAKACSERNYAEIDILNPKVLELISTKTPILSIDRRDHSVPEISVTQTLTSEDQKQDE